MRAGRGVSVFAMLPGGNPFLVLVVAALGMLEARRGNEHLFLANLGYGWGTVAAYLLLPAGGLEAAFTVLRFGWGRWGRTSRSRSAGWRRSSRVGGDSDVMAVQGPPSVRHSGGGSSVGTVVILDDSRKRVVMLSDYLPSMKNHA